MRDIANDGMFPEEEQDARRLRSQISDFWTELFSQNDSGGTTWDVLEFLQLKVTDLLYQNTLESISDASRLTAKAIYLISGGKD